MRTWFLAVAAVCLAAFCGVTSSQTTRPPHVVVTICEDEYRAKETLPPLMRTLADRLGAQCTVLIGNDAKTDIPGLDALETADVLVMFLRRTTLPAEQLDKFKAYFQRGGHVLALRTSSHAFQNWLEFDQLVLGGNYHGHYGRDALPTTVTVAAGAADHPIIRGVPGRFLSRGTLYKAGPLASDCRVLLEGRARDYPAEPVAWLRRHNGGLVFYTSLGHPDDFRSPAFRRLIANALSYLIARR